VTEHGTVYAWGKHNMSDNRDAAAHARPTQIDPAFPIDALAAGKLHGVGGTGSSSHFVHGRYPSPTLLSLWKRAVPAGLRNPWDPADRGFPNPGAAAAQREGQAVPPRKMSGANYANTYDHSMSISQLNHPPTAAGSSLAPAASGNHNNGAASELYRRDLENVQLQQSRDKAHFDSQVSAIKSEHASKLLEEVEKRVLTETRRLEEQLGKVSGSRIDDLESRIEQEEVEKEKAWAAYTLLRKVVDKEEDKKAVEDSMALKEHNQLARAREEIEVMRQEVQRLQDKAMAAYEAKDSIQRDMLSMSESMVEHRHEEANRNRKLRQAKEATLRKVAALYTTRLMKHAFMDFLLNVREPRMVTDGLRGKAEEVEKKYRWLRVFGVVYSTSLEKEASYQSYMAKQMASRVDSLEKTRKTLLAEGKNPEFQQKMLGIRAIASILDIYGFGCKVHCMEKWKTAVGVAMTERDGLQALEQSEAQRMALITQIQESNAAMSSADTRLSNTKHDKQEKGLKMIKFALRRMDVRGQGAALVQWRANISGENELYWQESI